METLLEHIRAQGESSPKTSALFAAVLGYLVFGNEVVGIAAESLYVYDRITVETGLEMQEHLTVVMATPENAVPDVQVFCYVGWEENEDDLFEWIKDSNNRALEYAISRNMAIASWTVAPMLESGQEVSGLPASRMMELKSAYRLLAKKCGEGLFALCERRGIIPSGIMLQGVSQGANYVNFFALEHATKISAVHSHLGDCFADGSVECSDIFWLLTTGQGDVYVNSVIAFYREMVDFETPILIKVGERLGHEIRADIGLLSYGFFDLSIDLRNKARQMLSDPTAVQTKSAEIYIRACGGINTFGDYINNEIFSAGKGEWVPVGQRVRFPSEGILMLWMNNP